MLMYSRRKNACFEHSNLFKVKELALQFESRGMEQGLTQVHHPNQPRGTQLFFSKKKKREKFDPFSVLISQKRKERKPKPD